MEILIALAVATLAIGVLSALEVKNRPARTEADLRRAYERALRRVGPDDPALALPAWQLACAYLSEDRAADAIPLLARCAHAARSEPQQPALAAWALAELAVCRAKIGEHDAALRHLDDADEAFGESASDAVRFARAEVALESCRELPVPSRVLEAERILRDLLHSMPAAPAAAAGPYRAATAAPKLAAPSADGTLGPEHLAFVHLRLAEALFHLDNDSEAAEHERIGFERYESDHTPSELAAFLVLQARWHRRHGREAHARTLLVRVLDLPPASIPLAIRAGAMLDLADIETRADRSADAIALLERAIDDLARSPADADIAAHARHALARLLRASGDEEAARRHAELAPPPFPQHDYLAAAQLRAARTRDDHDAVRALLDRMAETLDALDPDETSIDLVTEAWLHLAHQATNAHHTELATRAHHRADVLVTREDVSPAVALYHRLVTAGAHMRRADFTAAEHTIASMAELPAPYMEAHIHHATGWLSLVRADYAKAAEAYDRAAELMRPHHDERNARASSLLGAAWSLAELGRMDDARARRAAAAALVAITPDADERRTFLHLVDTLLALADHRPADAITEATAAATLAHRVCGTRSELYGHAQMALARAHLSAGKHEAAASHATTAADVFARYYSDAHPDLRRARALHASARRNAI